MAGLASLGHRLARIDGSSIPEWCSNFSFQLRFSLRVELILVLLLVIVPCRY